MNQRDNRAPDEAMSDQQRRDELVAHARRLVDSNMVLSSSVSIDARRGTVRNAWSDELLHYESGATPVALQLRPQPWGQA